MHPLTKRPSRGWRTIPAPLIALILVAGSAGAAVRIDRVDPSPICLGQQLHVLGSFGVQPPRYQVQIRPAAGGAPLASWGTRKVRWSSTRLTLSVGASAVAPGTYQLTVDTFATSGFASLRNVQVVNCATAAPSPSPPPSPSPSPSPAPSPAPTVVMGSQLIDATAHPPLPRPATGDPELEIVRVDGIGPKGPIELHPRTIQILVRNNGGGNPTVRPAIMLPGAHSRSSSSVLTFLPGAPVAIPAGTSKTLELKAFNIPTTWLNGAYADAARQGRRLPNYETEIFLLRNDLRATDGNVREASWQDAVPANHRRRVQFPIRPFDKWSINFKATRITIRDRCDHVSPGDWFFTMAACSASGRSCFGASPGSQNDYPSATALDVNDGDVLTFSDAFGTQGPRVHFEVPASYSGPVRFDMEARECDTGGHSWKQCQRAEEFPEVGPGGHADAGTGHLVVDAAAWKRGTAEALSTPVITWGKTAGNDCGDGDWSATVNVSSSPSWD